MRRWGGGLCDRCLNCRHESVYKALCRLSDAESRAHRLRQVCRDCCGGGEVGRAAAASEEDGIACDSLDCPVFYARVRQTTKLQYETEAVAQILDVLKVRR